MHSLVPFPLDVIFNSYRIYLQDQGKKGVKAAVYLMAIATGVLLTILVIMGAYYLFPGRFATYTILKVGVVQLLSTVPILQGLEKRYVTGSHGEAVLLTRSYQRGLLYALYSVYHFGSFFLIAFALKYTKLVPQ